MTIEPTKSVGRIRIQTRLPKDITIAVSGGIDSVVILDFLVKKHNVSMIHFNHQEGNSDEAQAFVESLADKYNIPLDVHHTDPAKPKGFSYEEWWRHGRYQVLHNYAKPIITCHHLDDCVETWIWSSMHGTGKIIPFNYKNVFRPFRLNTKQSLKQRAINKGLTWVEDESNSNLNFTRNYIRAEVIDKCLRINPGLHKTIARKVRQDLGDLAKWITL